jgi:hypothetical protein
MLLEAYPSPVCQGVRDEVKEEYSSGRDRIIASPRTLRVVHSFELKPHLHWLIYPIKMDLLILLHSHVYLPCCFLNQEPLSITGRSRSSGVVAVLEEGVGVGGKTTLHNPLALRKALILPTH